MSTYNHLDHLEESEYRFHIDGVKCQKCLAKIYKLRDTLPGLIQLNVNMGNQQLLVKIDKKLLKISKLADSIVELGFPLQPLQKADEAELINKKKNHRSLIGLAVAAAATGNIMLFSTANYAGASSQFALAFDWLSFALFIPILFYSAAPFWRSFITFIKTQTINIDLTIITAVLLGTIFSVYNLILQKGHVYFDSMAMLLLLLLASRFLLDRIQQKYLNTNFLNPLLLENSVEVWIPCDQQFSSRPVKNILKGDKVRIYKNQSLPVDGRLMDNSAFLNTSILTGESKPQSFLKNDKIYAGSQVLSNYIDVKVEAVGAASRMGKLLTELSEQLHTDTELTAQLNRVAKIFTIAILSIAGLLLLYFSPIDFAEGVQRALALVILACPCALGLAVPLTQSLGLIKASKLGIIIKDGNALHKICKIKNFVFDKTGTLTQGVFELLKWHEVKSLTDLDYSIILSMEQKARHPIGKSIVMSLQSSGFKKVDLNSWKEVFGVGVSAYFDKDLYELKAAPEDFSNKDSNTLVGYYKNSDLVAVIYFGDKLLAPAKSVISELAESSNIHILSGDNPQVTEVIASQLGIPQKNVFSSATPEQKVTYVKSLTNCAMVGDGANDAAALSSADIGIAVKGSMAASLKAASIYFSHPEIERLLILKSVAQKFDKTVNGHLIFSAVYNITGALAAIFGLINPLIAAILMPASSLTVLLTSLYGMRDFEKQEKNTKICSTEVLT